MVIDIFNFLGALSLKELKTMKKYIDKLIKDKEQYHGKKKPR